MLKAAVTLVCSMEVVFQQLPSKQGTAMDAYNGARTISSIFPSLLFSVTHSMLNLSAFGFQIISSRFHGHVGMVEYYISLLRATKSPGIVLR